MPPRTYGMYFTRQNVCVCSTNVPERACTALQRHREGGGTMPVSAAILPLEVEAVFQGANV